MTSRAPVDFCRRCGTQVEHRLPDDGDTKIRAICPACHTVHYENPLNVVGTIPYMGDKVLLCLRNIEPRKGYWTLPAGFMELDETTGQGAERETDEEAGADITMGPLFSLVNVPHVGQVHLFYLAQLQSTEFKPGWETIEARLFSEAEIPWDQIAFRTVKVTLQRYFEDRKRGAFGIHVIDLETPAGPLVPPKAAQASTPSTTS
ncbi:NUDIX hydrolase [Comamonas sp. B-9]|uniref:NUDIX hydrolase n=1 Tax=Comamonas sp. B-9 TaxID=1055192 RepID=UPI000395CB8A|nr:NUDIX hydrolase [Comamonas sp. B-9]